MKKALSLFLAVLMMFSFSAVAFAEGEVPACTHGEKCAVCEDCTGESDCRCCVFCPFYDKGRIVSCATVVFDANGHVAEISYCCQNCTGQHNCKCGANGDPCSCQQCLGESTNIEGGIGEPLIPEKEQGKIVDAFQRIIRQVYDALMGFFDTIFEFLRIDEVLGR